VFIAQSCTARYVLDIRQRIALTARRWYSTAELARWGPRPLQGGESSLSGRGVRRISRVMTRILRRQRLPVNVEVLYFMVRELLSSSQRPLRSKEFLQMVDTSLDSYMEDGLGHIQLDER